ncbi:MarR family winged helix-turn-helix transcriptional regulator [Gorillibacterium sp. sgz5001074]|uniref:MarR family winged helix-turn-helix transcriptional regulator n=1 Tax=Gorillibacterium sp. sgz5001074 TaxID=3446695 RepID=UPI003F67950B
MDVQQPETVYQTFTHVTRLHFHRLHGVLEPLGIYPGQPPLLFILDRHDGISQKDLATRLHVRPATLTVMLRRMEQNGWVARRPDLHDQRVSRVSLTDPGRELCEQARARMRVMAEELFGSMPEEDRAEMQRLLHRLRENLLAAGPVESLPGYVRPGCHKEKQTGDESPC